MVVPVFRLILIFFPTIFFKLCQMLCARVSHQVTSLLDPSKLQLDTVQDRQFLVCIPEIIQTAMKPFVFLQFRDRCLIGVIYKNISGQSPLLISFTAVSLGAIGFSRSALL